MPLDAEDPQMVGDYVLCERLGQGAMGVVYIALDPGGRKVALKVMRPEFSQDKTVLHRFREEARHSSGVDSIYIARMIEANVDSDQPYLVMDLIDGPTLAEQVTQRGPLSMADGIIVAKGTAAALTALHEAGIIHRDINPSNVLLSRLGPRVIDFGIAVSAGSEMRITQSGALVGTPAYMSPEQIMSEDLTSSSDVFSWGGMMIFALTGHQPFGAADTNIAVLYARILEGKPNLTGVPGSLGEVIVSALDKDPASRPTAQDLVDSLTSPQRVRAPSPSPRRRFPHHAPWPLLDLDVAKFRAAGYEAVPFRRFILNMANQTGRQRSKRIDPAMAGKIIERIAEHVQEHDLASVDVILSGEEPVSAEAESLFSLFGFVGWLRGDVAAEVNVAVQTNGTLLDRPTLNVLKSLGIRVGVSLDGDSEGRGLRRSHPSGRDSFDAAAQGLDLLQSSDFQDCYSGLSWTIDIGNDPVGTYEALLKFRPPMIDFLLPNANWSSPPPGSGYSDWLITVFERWYAAPEQETRIRLFSELIQLIFGYPTAEDGIGLQPSTQILIDTDGSIKQLDTLSFTYPGAADTGLNVMSASFSEALDHPTTVARQVGADALSVQCRACPVMEVCGGGLYEHRFRDGAGFRNPSVYCTDLLRLITHVRGRVAAGITPQLNILSPRA